jgi:hypothetical protein
MWVTSSSVSIMFKGSMRHRWKKRSVAGSETLKPSPANSWTGLPPHWMIVPMPLSD